MLCQIGPLELPLRGSRNQFLQGQQSSTIAIKTGTEKHNTQNSFIPIADIRAYCSE
ncbi:hypothetical protein BOA8489_03798 [Boseongicola aestuarii]|uniref:Uncharacterized protein n=1 Tax=Boseongicola aestuarii TaxID=1470561 RepID=A0A238J712_9RHOB|nr:hypothetical protein BOA8489_03798 [Boseongicola aestuarii]